MKRLLLPMSIAVLLSGCAEPLRQRPTNATTPNGFRVYVPPEVSATEAEAMFDLIDAADPPPWFVWILAAEPPFGRDGVSFLDERSVIYILYRTTRVRFARAAIHEAAHARCRCYCVPGHLDEPVCAP